MATGGNEQVVEGGVNGDRRGQARRERRPASAIGMSIGERLRDDREDRRRRAVQHRGAEPAHEPQHQRRVAERAQVDDVLDEREAGADGEAQHRRVDEESDPTPRDSRNAMNSGLERSPR